MSQNVIRGRVQPGQRYGMLEVLRRAPRTAYWVVRCDCGTEKQMQSALLAWAKRPARSCGCQRTASLRAKATKHGASIEGAALRPTFIAWQSMQWRCYNKNRKDFSRYGGRGIRVCERWLDRFDHFLADMGRRPVGNSLGRIDNDGDYCPGNCRWESSRQQANNRRTNRLIKWNGIEQTVTEWARQLDIGKDTLRLRLEAGWSVDRAFTELVRGAQK